jgi:ornithine carrier protein
MVRETGGGAAYFGVYEGACRVMLNWDASGEQWIDDKRLLKPWQLIIAGGLAGVAFHATFFPADVFKSIYQTRSHAELTASIPKKSSAADYWWSQKSRVWRSLLVEIYRRDGIRGFYQGMGITMLRAIPSNAAIFLTYETLVRKLEES